MTIEKMKQWLKALEEAVHYTSAPVWSPSMTEECNEAITSLRQAIAEAERQDQQIDQLILERDHAHEIIDKLCDAVLGADRHEWSSMYFFEDAVRDVEERMAEAEKQEPVAWQVMVEDEAMKEFPIKDMAHDWCLHQKLSGSPHSYWIRPLYTHPPQPGQTSAERTLKSLGYTDNGGEYWKPPLGAWPPQPKQEPVAMREALKKLARFLDVVRVYAQEIRPIHELETDKPLHWKAREIQDEVIRLINTIPQQEPIHWIAPNFEFLFSSTPQHTEQEPVIDKSAAIRIATALGWEPKREWVGLTDEEIDDLAEFHGLDFMSYAPFTRAIEDKLEEKNT